MTKVALLIGVSEYAPGLNPLPSATSDIEAMKRVLQHPEIGGFAERDITLLGNPMRQEMEEAIFYLFASRSQDDLLLLFFSGHALKDESGKLFLTCQETRKDQEKFVKPTAVSASYVHEIMSESRSKRQIVILDCCFSGAFAQGMAAKADDRVDIKNQLGGEGRAILTSSTSTQYSLAPQGLDLSIYTHYLVEGIEKGAADLDSDGWISIDELHEYTSSKVQEAAPSMKPEFYPVKEGHRILLAKAPLDNPELKYRKEVEVLAREDEGELSFINRCYLDELRVNLALLLQVAMNIEAEVLAPYRQRRNNLQRYEQIFCEAIRRQYPFRARERQGLKRLQQLLSLRDEDIEPLEARIASQVPSTSSTVGETHTQGSTPISALIPARGLVLIGTGVF